MKRKWMLGVVMFLMVLTFVFPGVSAYAGSTRSPFDGYPFESSILMDTVVDIIYSLYKNWETKSIIREKISILSIYS